MPSPFYSASVVLFQLHGGHGQSYASISHTLHNTWILQGGNFHLKVGGAKSSGNAGDPMLGVAVSGGYNHPNHKVGGGQK